MAANCTATARKSLGEFKPLIRYADGRTEVCEKSPERAGHHTKYGYVPGNRMARGTTYTRREDAIAASIGDASLNMVTGRLTRVDRALILSRLEAHFLAYLMVNENRLVPKQELYLEVWGMRFVPETNSLAVHLNRLRNKVDRGHPVPLLHTIPGGVVLSAEIPEGAIPWVYARRTNHD